MNAVLETLFLPLTQGIISQIDFGLERTFLGAQYHPLLEELKPNFLQQHFKPYATFLEEQGFKVHALDFPAPGTQDMIFMLAPKNAGEAESLIAAAHAQLKSGGLLVAAADNKAGGSRLEKWLQKAGFGDISHLSKNKARVVWGHKENKNTNISLPAPQSLQMQNGKNFYSWKGIFSWNKIDKGSEILLQNLPHDFSGTGADYGCGYGYLSQNLLQNNKEIKKLYCIDADKRALLCCAKNCKDFSETDYLWEDLTQPVAALKNLDFIIMNPPFHEGKKTDSTLGVAFLKTAAQSLKSGGVLWFVANVHLPYEDKLKALFSSNEKRFEGQGFKVFCCVK